MIADTTFLSHLLRERDPGAGPATRFLARRRTESFLVTVISVGELAVLFDTNQEARLFLQRYCQLRLFPEIAYAAAEVDRELINRGLRLGENDNWIAGFQQARAPMIEPISRPHNTDEGTTTRSAYSPYPGQS